MIKLSVIMSCYNAEKFVDDAIRSILNQTYKNIEFIIINDGSNDKTLDIISNYSIIDDRIIVINHSNKGLTKSLNIGINKATGDFIARMDADDISMPDRFINFISFLKKNKAVDIYTTPAYNINSSGVVYRLIPNYLRRNGFHNKMLNYYNSLTHGTLIIRATVFKKYRYNEEYRYSQDSELYQRLLKDNHNLSYDKNNISYKARVHSNQVTNKHSSEQIECSKAVFRNNNNKYYKRNLKNKLFVFFFNDFFLYLKVKIGWNEKTS
jgi:glycosyltransferase involved in cell wall biosynthesis